MVVCRKPLILSVDLAGCGALAALLTAALLLVVLPLYRQLGALPHLRGEVVAARQQRTRLVARNAALQQTLATREQTLAAELERPLTDVSTFLAHMSEECGRAGIQLQQVQPDPAEHTQAAVRHWRVRVQARGSFPGFTRLLREMENWSPFVQIREIAVLEPPAEGSAGCDLTWTVQVSYLAGAADDSRAAQGGES